MNNLISDDKICNSNWTEWSTIQVVIAWVTTTTWIVWHEVQLLINRINNKIRR